MPEFSNLSAEGVGDIFPAKTSGGISWGGSREYII